MTKYEKSKIFLKNNKKEKLTISYELLENILGFSLPNSAYQYKAFFANDFKTINNTHSLSKIWKPLGYKQVKLVLGEYFILEKESGFIND